MSSVIIQVFPGSTKWAKGLTLPPEFLHAEIVERNVAGQDDDGTLNGKDYTERRLVTAWKRKDERW